MYNILIGGVCKHWTGLLDYWTDSNYKNKWDKIRLVMCDLHFRDQQLTNWMQSGSSSYKWPRRTLLILIKGKQIK